MAARAQAIPGHGTEQSNWSPTAKVSVGALAGAATTMLLVALRANGVKAIESPEVGAAITTLLTFAIQYVVPDRK